MRPRRGLALAGLCLLLGATAAFDAAYARGKAKDRVRLSDLPGWVREVAERPLPRQGHDVTWLLEDTRVEPLAEGGVRITTRRAGRVEREPGREVLGSWAEFYGEDDEVVSQQTWNLLPDGTARAAKPGRDLFDRPAVDGFSVYNDARVSVIVVPGVRTGSIVAYESVVSRGFDTGAQPFYFGSLDEPTASSRFTLRVPEGWGWEAVRQRMDGTGIELTEEENGFTLAGGDLEAQPRAELRPSDRELLPVVWGRWWSPDGKRGFEGWDAVARWYEELSAPVLDQAGETADIGARLKPTDPSALRTSLTEAFAIAARQVRYVSVQIGIGGYRPVPPADV